MGMLWAKVKLNKKQDFENLIKMFFKEFNESSSISVRGKEAKLEVAFDNPPMEIIDAINQCEIIELNYGRCLNEYEGDGSKKTEKSSIFEKENTVEVEEKSKKAKSTQLEENAGVNKEIKIQNKPKKKGESKARKKIPRRTDNLELPELAEIAKKAKSFENFAELVTEWLKITDKKEYFINLIIESAKLDTIRWKDFDEVFKNKNLHYTRWDRICMIKEIWNTLNDDSINALSLLEEIRRFKDYPFNHAKMACMPENKEFEKTLATIDKTKPVEERVLYVLNAMGLNNIAENDQKMILEIANKAVKKETQELEDIFNECDIPQEQVMTARVTFAKFVNDFVEKHNGDKKVKLLTFLSELKKIVTE